MFPQQISHYRVLSLLGRGGMGEVYLAEDTQLHRKVAIKLLPANESSDEQARSRLLREARAAAMLDHPGICGIHEVGEADGRAFIVMQYVEGETLADRLRRGPLDVHQAAAIIAQVAEALDEAHARQLIHRDIKPQNLMLTARGQIKVLDFGLAKRLRAAFTGTESTMAVTAQDSIVGTPLYMSPEQLRGEELDERSDLFSLGSVFYELLTGQSPFAASSAVESLSAILTRQPSWPADAAHVPAELRRMVGKCLEKDRERRYQSARELLGDLRAVERESEGAAPALPSTKPSVSDRLGRRALLAAVAALALAGAVWTGWRWFGTGTGPQIRSIAVLPFTNVNADKETEYLAVGITDSIISALSQLSDLKVLAHTAVSHYKNRPVDAREVGTTLDVEAVLTGRLVQREDTLSIHVELVNARDSSYIWGAEYDRSLADLLAIQHEIPADVSNRLRAGANRASTRPDGQGRTTSPEVYQLYLKGRYSWELWTPDGARQAIQYFEEAIRKDPDYALAHAGLANVYAFGTVAPGLTQEETHRRAKDASFTALTLDPLLGEAHTAAAAVLGAEWDFAGSEREFKRAIELNPNDAEAHHQYSHLHLVLGRTEAALAEAKAFLALDPVSESPLGHMAWVYVYSRQYDEAIAWALKDLAVYPLSTVRAQLADAYFAKRMFTEGVDEHLKHMAQVGVSQDRIAALKKTFVEQGFEGLLRAEIVSLESRPRGNEVSIAQRYAKLGDATRAFEWLEKAFAARSSALNRLKEDIWLDDIRSHPQFSDLLRRVGLPQ